MTVNIVTFLEQDLKNSVVEIFNETNETAYQPDTQLHTFVSTGDDKTVILQGPFDGRGVIVDKVNIAHLFMNTIDLKTFKTRRVQQTEVITETNIDLINQKHGIKLMVGKEALLPDNGRYPQNVVDDFNLFCRVTGFFELSIYDVVLSHDGHVMHISVVPSHKLFTGSIEVQV